MVTILVGNMLRVPARTLERTPLGWSEWDPYSVCKIWGDSGWIEATNALRPGENVLYFGEWNENGGNAWDFSLKYNGTVVRDSHAGKMGEVGANNDDRSRQMQTIYGQSLFIRQDGTFALSGDNQGVDGSSIPIAVGDTVNVTTIGLAIHLQPRIDKEREIGVAKQGSALHVIGGPVVVPTTSDDDQPMLRNWWLVTGWDASGSSGWCSARYLQGE